MTIARSCSCFARSDTWEPDCVRTSAGIARNATRTTARTRSFLMRESYQACTLECLSYQAPYRALYDQHPTVLLHDQHPTVLLHDQHPTVLYTTSTLPCFTRPAPYRAFTRPAPY